MQKLVSQIPQLSSYLSRIDKQHHKEAIRHIINLGLEVQRSLCCQRQNNDHYVENQLNNIRHDILELSQVVRQQAQHSCQCCQQNRKRMSNTKEQGYTANMQSISNDREIRRNTKSPKKEQNQKPTKDVPELSFGKQNVATQNPFSKRKPFVSRHHLDDSAARQALQFPPCTFVEPQPRVKRQSHDYKKHVYQEEINKEELTKIKQEKEKGESLDKLKRDRTYSDYGKATSKIKALLDKDRIRFIQKKRDQDYQAGFNQYEYSDESQMEESSLNEGQNEQTYPRFYQGYSQQHRSDFKGSKEANSSQKQRTSERKQFQRSRNDVSGQLEASEERSRQSSNIEFNQKRNIHEQSSGANRNIDYEEEEDNDVISNSSSFSQFSISGSRKKEVGKISRRSQRD